MGNQQSAPLHYRGVDSPLGDATHDHFGLTSDSHDADAIAGDGDRLLPVTAVNLHDSPISPAPRSNDDDGWYQECQDEGHDGSQHGCPNPKCNTDTLPTHTETDPVATVHCVNANASTATDATPGEVGARDPLHIDNLAATRIPI